MWQKELSFAAFLYPIKPYHSITNSQNNGIFQQ